MGFVLFTETGTFDPKTYGLKAGDMLHVKVVGGGGGGGRGFYSAVAEYSGTAGSASSFGDVLTAKGGLPGGAFSKQQTIVPGSNTGGQGGNSTHLGQAYYYGGTGGDGWMPNYYGTSGIPPFLLLPHSITGSSTSGLSFGPLTPQNDSYLYSGREFSFSATAATYGGIAAANTLPYGHAGSVYSGNTSSYKVMSAGGVGYGAGGGTCIATYSQSEYSCGGSSGVIADANYELPDTNEIAVTVGAGGTGYKEGSTIGGGGANGCVAIWW